MIPTLNYDAVFSDPLLMVAGVFLIVGPLVFLVALVKFLSWGRKQKEAIDYSELNPFGGPFRSSDPLEAETPLSETEIEHKLEPEPQPVITEKESEPESSFEPEFAAAKMGAQMEKTVMMPSGMGEVQGQLEIAFSQIKTLSKKVAQMESELDSVARNAVGKLDRNELQEVPMNPADFTQKLLKLAEHVIVLEKEVERLKTGNTSKKPSKSDDTLPPTSSSSGDMPTFPRSPKPPMMPI